MKHLVLIGFLMGGILALGQEIKSKSNEATLNRTVENGAENWNNFLGNTHCCQDVSQILHATNHRNEIAYFYKAANGVTNYFDGSRKTNWALFVTVLDARGIVKFTKKIEATLNNYDPYGVFVLDEHYYVVGDEYVLKLDYTGKIVKGLYTNYGVIYKGVSLANNGLIVATYETEWNRVLGQVYWNPETNEKIKNETKYIPSTFWSSGGKGDFFIEKYDTNNGLCLAFKSVEKGLKQENNFLKEIKVSNDYNFGYGDWSSDGSLVSYGKNKNNPEIFGFALFNQKYGANNNYKKVTSIPNMQVDNYLSIIETKAEYLLPVKATLKHNNVDTPGIYLLRLDKTGKFIGHTLVSSKNNNEELYNKFMGTMDCVYDANLKSICFYYVEREFTGTDADNVEYGDVDMKFYALNFEL